MKKSLLALAVLGTFAGAASAQSSVTLFGTIDVNARYIKNDGTARRLSESTDGINSSQLGFQGVEDLGGGLKASFILLAGVNPDVGTTNTKFFNRRATVSLSGGFGEIRLGRDYTPTFWTDTLFDPYGANGVGNTFSVKGLFTTASVSGYLREDNAIGYFLPSNLGGVYGQLMAAAGEGGPSGTVAANGTFTPDGARSDPGRYLGGRLGFAAGPFDVAVAASQQRYTGNFANPVIAPNAALGNRSQLRTYNVGGSYDFGFMKLLAHVDREAQDRNREVWGQIGVVVPVGQGVIKAAYDRAKANTATFTNTNNMYSLGYVYNLSKRTALYGTLSRLDNGNHATSSVGSSLYDGTSIAAVPTVGGKSSGGEVGIRHFF